MDDAAVGAGHWRPHVPDHVVDHGGREDGHGGDLEGQARDAHVDADLRRAAAGGRQRATDGLQDKRDGVTGDEYPDVQTWGDARVGWGEEGDAVGWDRWLMVSWWSFCLSVSSLDTFSRGAPLHLVVLHNLAGH